jgi:hypothetical protein
MHINGSWEIFEGTVKTNHDGWFNVGSSTVTGTLNFVTVAGQRTQVWDNAQGKLVDKGIQGVTIAGYPVPNYTLNDTSGDGILSGPVEAAPLLYNIDDFRPGGTIWNQIPSNRRVAITGADDWHWPGTGAPKALPTQDGRLQGLIFVDGSLGTQGSGDFNARDYGDGVTIVATGNVRISGNNIYMKPYWDNLVVMAGGGGYTQSGTLPSTTTGGDCSTDVVQFNTTNFMFGTQAKPGLIYSPWGTARVPASSINPSYGQMIAYRIHTNVSNAHIIYGPAASSPGDPELYYVQ